MARSIIHRRPFGAILVAQLATALLCTRSDFGVQSFVLRSRSIDDLAAALANADDVAEEEPEAEGGVEGVDLFDRPPSWSNSWDDADFRPKAAGIYDDFEDVSDEDDGTTEQDESDMTLGEKMFEAIGSREAGDAADDESGDPGSEESAETSSDGKVPLNKSELQELFDIVTPETVTETFPAVTVDKKSEMTKNEVESLFEKVASDITAAAATPDKEDFKAVIVSSVGNTSESGTGGGGSGEAASGVGPTVKVMTIEEVVKTVAKEKSGDTEGGSGAKDVVLDVKEAKITPSGSEKLTKEWLVQLDQPDDEKQYEVSNGELYAAEDGWRGGSRKFKRSLPASLSDANFKELEATADGKTRAVELLKAYIRLQEEENRHLTEALDLATLGQAEKTDNYLDGQIEHLRQAVDDERSIEAIRALIRAEEAQYEDEDDGAEDFATASQQDAIGELPVAYKRGQSVFVRESLPPMPELLAFGAAADDDDNGYAVAESESGNDVIVDDDDVEEEERLREKLREYELQTELDEIRRAADAAVEAEAVDSSRSPEVIYLPPPVNYRNTFRDPRFNPFMRDFEEKLGYRPSFVATKRFEPIKIQKYADDDDVEEDEDVDDEEDDEEEEERRREVLQQVEAAVEAAAEEEQRRAFIENLQEALQLPASLNAADVSDGGEDGQLEDSALGVCPAVQELTDNCLVARERGLTLDDEALQLCNRHQLCYSCGDQYGLLPDACDRGYLAEADRLCSDPSSSSSSRCRREAASLYVMMLDGHRAHSGSGYTGPESCRQICAYHFIVGTAASARR